MFDSTPRQTPVPSDRKSRFPERIAYFGALLLLSCLAAIALVRADLSWAQSSATAPAPTNKGIWIEPITVTIGDRLAPRRIEPIEIRILGRPRLPIEETIVSVAINKQPVAAAVAILQVEGLGVVIPHEDFKSLRLETVKTPIAIRRVDEYVPLARIPGITAQVDMRTLELNITAPSNMFAVTRLAMESRAQGPVSPAATGAFLNYDLLASRSSADRTYGGTLEGVLFNRYGSLVSNLLASRSPDESTRAVRLDTYYQMDFPDRLNRLRLGDNITTSGSWGRAVRYGGIKFGTDFSLSPNLISMPLLNLGATAALPSTVDLYINNALQRRYSVPPGPFAIDQIPIITGAGDGRIVVRNALGQDQIIEVPFFRLPLQLRAGLSDYALEVGRLRNNFPCVRMTMTPWLRPAFGATVSLIASPASCVRKRSDKVPVRWALRQPCYWAMATRSIRESSLAAPILAPVLRQCLVTPTPGGKYG